MRLGYHNQLQHSTAYNREQARRLYILVDKERDKQSTHISALMTTKVIKTDGACRGCIATMDRVARR